MNDNFLRFTTFFKENKKDELKNGNSQKDIKVINEFNNEYPIERIRNLSLTDYIYEVGSNKTFCSRLVYHYNNYGVGPKINAGSINGKFGIYYLNGRYVDYNTEEISNPTEYYQEINKQLVEVLTNISVGIQDIDYTKYDHLQGMWNVILKISYYINPDNNLNFGKFDILKTICKYFNIPVKKTDNALNLSYRIKKYIDNNIEEAKELHSCNIGSLIWDFYEKFIVAARTSDDYDGHTPTDDVGKNIIYYGVPGCGKSFQVDKKAKEFSNDFVFRTVFHPDYTYTDFIGQIVPISKDNKIEYKKNMGPFTRALCCAYANPQEQILLIIEEINRGNAAAIFGDIFQLLDRGCEYKITNEYICSCLKDYTNGKYEDNKFNIPNNLTILATMNTSDQNVFTLDNAFRRRFEYVRIPNEFDLDDKSNELRDTIISGLGVTWGYFVNLINNYIMEQSELLLNNEDKRLGVYSIISSEIMNANKFADKILFYLWDNIGKYNDGKLFKEGYKLYDQVIDDYLDGNNVFCDEIFNNIEQKKDTNREADNE